MYPDDMDEAQAERPSKSELKRRVESLQKAGESLIGLRAGQLERMPLPDELRLAVQEGQKLRNKHAAFKRQRQYIGRLMREIDAEPIIQALSDLEETHHTETSHFHDIEHWRERLLAGDGTQALTELIAEHPEIEVQPLRQQIGKARRELQGGKGKHAQRELFAMLRVMIS